MQFGKWRCSQEVSTALFHCVHTCKQVYEVRNYHKSPRYQDLLPLLGAQSMVLSEGEDWRAQRDAFNPGFSSTFLRAALPGFVDCTKHLITRLEQAADDGQVVFMHYLAVAVTLEVICKVLMTKLHVDNVGSSWANGGMWMSCIV